MKWIGKQQLKGFSKNADWKISAPAKTAEKMPVQKAAGLC